MATVDAIHALIARVAVDGKVVELFEMTALVARRPT